MKEHLITKGLGILEIGGGIVVKTIFENLLWLGWLLIGIGIFSVVLGFAWKPVTKHFKWIISKLRLVIKVLERINEVDAILSLKNDQQEHPEKWLYPVIEYIDLNRQGSAHDDNDVYISFGIDSGLLTQIHEYRIFVKLALSYEFKQQESGWYKVIPVEPLRALTRTRISSKAGKFKEGFESFDYSEYMDGFGDILHLGFTEQAKEHNKLLLDWMDRFRNNEKVHAMLKIGVVFKNGKENNPIVLDGSRWIAPMNDYRG